jgi:hypothetical protein
MRRDQVVRTEVAAGLLVRQQTQDHVARRLRAAGRNAHQGGEHHRHPALHVQRTTAPEMAARQLARERWVLPLPARWYDVDMPLQKQRRAFSPSDQPRDQVGALGLLGENANLYA